MTLKKIMALYAQHHNVNVVLIQGSSGALSRQIIHGLPVDIFLSADKKNVQYLIEHQMADHLFAYAIGEVVLLVKSPQKYNSAKEYLVNTPHVHLSLAKPKLSPYGAHSEIILRHMDLWNTFRSQVIYGENIGLAFNYFITGNATAGFIARSQLIEYEEINGLLKAEIHYYTFADPASRITQYGVILKDTREANAAHEFVHYVLHSKEAQHIIHKMGYSAPH